MLTLRQEDSLRLAGERMIIVPARAYTAIYDAIFDIAGPAAAAPLYYLGRKIGMGLIEELRSRLDGATSRTSILEKFAKLFEELGLGRLEVLQMGGHSAVVKLVDPASMQGCETNRHRCHCHIERGMLAAVFDEITGMHHIAREAESGGSPEPYCVIKIVCDGRPYKRASR